MRDEASACSEQDIAEIFARLGDVEPVLTIGVGSAIGDRTGGAGLGD